MKALYAGSFDPITNGHLDIIKQAASIFSTVFIGVARNPDKKNLFMVNARVALISIAIEDLRGNFEVVPYSGLTVEEAHRLGAAYLVRGLRAVSDFDSEFQMTQFNRKLAQGVNTLFLMPDEKNFYLSSSAIRGIAKMGGDVSPFVPAGVADALRSKFRI